MGTGERNFYPLVKLVLANCKPRGEEVGLATVEYHQGRVAILG